MCLDTTLIPAGQKLCDLRPLVPEASVVLEDDEVLLGLPGILTYVRVEVVVPSANDKAKRKNNTHAVVMNRSFS